MNKIQHMQKYVHLKKRSIDTVKTGLGSENHAAACKHQWQTETFQT